MSTTIKSSPHFREDVYNMINLLSMADKADILEAVKYCIDVKEDVAGLACDRTAAKALLPLLRKQLRAFG